MTRRDPLLLPTVTTLLLWLLLGCWAYAAIAVTLEQALLDDIFPASSSFCAGGSRNTTSFQFDFSPSNSSWSPRTAPYEPLVFLAEMHHHDGNPNRTWTMRIGRGGQVYSWRGAYGEAIPPQASKNAAWMDTVLQMVSVNLDRNDGPEDLYYVHQAGTYMTDPPSGVPPPFYSPTLAMQCVDSRCDVVSWGQQAHIPTIHRSDVLYYIRYQNCGDGVVEMTQVIHNAASDPSDVLDYVNVPWTGLRKSTFHDALLSGVNGSLHHDFPMKLFNDDLHKIPDLKDMGGFTTFAQRLPAPLDSTVLLPCINSNGSQEVDCEEDRAIVIRPVVVRNDSCLFIAGLSNRFGYSVLRMELFEFDPYTPTIEGCRQWCGPANGLLFVNNRTGFSFEVNDVVHWVHSGRFLYFSSNVSAAEINDQFVEGDVVGVRFGVGGIPRDDNLAITFVHGVDQEYSDPNNTKFQKPTRMRHGGVLAVERDALIYTINFLGNITPGDTYINRQFILSGKLSSMEDRAQALVGETHQELLSRGDFYSRKLTLFATNTSFAIAVGNVTCHQGVPQCVGSSTPTEDMSPLFFIACGNLTYVGSDQYYFAPPRDGTTAPFRPYICNGQDSHVRPEWKLLGYFRKNHCKLPVDLEYSLCNQ